MRQLAAMGGLLAVAVLGGCQMLDSRYLETDPAEAGTTCHSNAGTYHLPRRLLTVTVTTPDPTSVAFKNGYVYAINVDVSSSSGAPYVADRDETYCLDFLLSYLSDDRVGIQRDNLGLLQRVFTQANDRTKDIAQKLIQAGADLAAADRAGLPGRSSRLRIDKDKAVIATFQFDPFVEREAREVNNALSEFGYCVYLDARNDAFVPRWSEEICREIAGARTKKRVGREDAGPLMVYKTAYPRSGLPAFDPRPVPRELQEKGILYRPELSHSLIVIRKPDPGSRHSEWRAVASERFVAPNAAPAFILEVQRAIFVTAQTDVQFSNGLIKNISINKPSELLVAADLTVAAVQIVQNIPAQALKIFNNRAQNTMELMRVNALLIDTLRAHGGDANSNAQAQRGTDLILGRQAPIAGVPDQQQQLMQHCLEQGAGPDVCKSQILPPAQ